MVSQQGLKFPWESAVSGREVCPEDIYGKQEIHINGDITLAFQHYLYLTQVFHDLCRSFHECSLCPLSTFVQLLCLTVPGSVHVH